MNRLSTGYSPCICKLWYSTINRIPKHNWKNDHNTSVCSSSPFGLFFIKQKAMCVGMFHILKYKEQMILFLPHTQDETVNTAFACSGKTLKGTFTFHGFDKVKLIRGRWLSCQQSHCWWQASHTIRRVKNYSKLNGNNKVILFSLISKFLIQDLFWT